MGYSICTTGEITVSVPSTGADSSNLIYYAGNSLSGTITDNFGKSSLSIEYIGTKPAWITNLGIALKDSTAGYIKLSASANTTTSSRSCKIRLKNTNTTSSNYITITLAPGTVSSTNHWYLTVIVCIPADSNRHVASTYDYPRVACTIESIANVVGIYDMSKIDMDSIDENISVVYAGSKPNYFLVMTVSNTSNITCTMRNTNTYGDTKVITLQTGGIKPEYNTFSSNVLFAEYPIGIIDETTANTITAINATNISSNQNIVRYAWYSTSLNSGDALNLIANPSATQTWNNRTSNVLFFANKLYTSF